jgi:hypothetical protein
MLRIMMGNFTSKQKEILKIAKEKGYVILENFRAVFSSPISRKSNLERFIALGILTSIEGKFKLNVDKLKELDGK